MLNSGLVENILRHGHYLVYCYLLYYLNVEALLSFKGAEELLAVFGGFLHFGFGGDLIFGAANFEGHSTSSLTIVDLLPGDIVLLRGLHHRGSGGIEIGLKKT